jgi:hypothetical protein
MCRRVRGHFARGSAARRYPLSLVYTKYTVMKLEIAEAG